METYQYNFTTITKGVCSADTVTKLATRECQKYLAAEPNKIYTTLNIIMNDMCAADEIPSALEGLRLNREDFKKAHNKTSNRLTPIGLVLDLDDGLVSTDLKFGNNIVINCPFGLKVDFYREF